MPSSSSLLNRRGHWLQTGRRLLAVACCFLSLTAYAQQVRHLTFRHTDGTERSIPLQTGMRITLSAANGCTVEAQGQQLYTAPLASLQQLWFAQEPTAVAPLLSSDLASDERIDVYSLDGRRVATTTAAEAHQLSLSTGVYLLRGARQTRKVMFP